MPLPCNPPDPVIDEIVRRLVAALHPDLIYLFGSHAHGECNPEADIELLVVVSSSDQPGHVRDGIAARTLRGLKVQIDVVVLTREEFDSKHGAPGSLAASMIREGVLVHAA
jgi:predicted nucleotidyltransferase